MSRMRVSTSAFFLLALAVLAGVLAHLHANGFRSPVNMDLLGFTLLTSSGQISFPDVMISYPSAPLALMIVLHWPLSLFGAFMPSVLSALLAALLVAGWFGGFRSTGLGQGASLGAAAMIGGNPLFLRAAAEGISALLPICGLWMLAKGMLNLRREPGVNNLILISFALVLLSASGPLGLVIALSSVPFLALIAASELIAQSVIGFYLVFLFPLAFSAGGFVFLNWMFSGDPLHFLKSGLASPGVERLTEAAQMPAGMVALTVAGTLLTSALALWGLVRHHRFEVAGRGFVAVLGTLVTAICIARLVHVLPAPALTASLGCGVTAACVPLWARHRSMRAIILPAVALSFVAGVLVLGLDASTGAARLRQAALMHRLGTSDPTTEGLAGVLRGKSGILFDASAAPAVVAERGSARGISGAQSHAFQLAALTHQLKSPVLVVRSVQSTKGADTLGRAFPELFRSGAPGYRLVFDSPTWRVFQSDEEATP